MQGRRNGEGQEAKEAEVIEESLKKKGQRRPNPERSAEAVGTATGI